MAEPQELNMNALETAILNALHSVNPEQYREPTKQLLLSAFDKYVVPYDIPRIPEFVERPLEASVRAAIPTWVDRLFDGLKEPGGAAKAADATKDAFAFLTAPKAE